jgi:GT2 family glycosyltransferase
VTGRLRIAVCTNRTPAEAGEALGALAAQAPSDALVVVTSGLDPEAVRAHQAAFAGTVLEEPRKGLSRARNRALACCDEEDVLAFVDDDAVVCSGWFAGLLHAWESASEDVACIGGPIRPRWPAGGPPSWISPPILPALTLLDLGSERLVLDPEVTTVFGANISFRVSALRRIGGFDPAFGHSGRRLFFSEEDEAQRALARLGYLVRYVPDAAVEHVIPPERLTRAAFVRRRFAYGVTLGVRRARPLSLAARQALSSALGALAALGRRQLFMERAVRAAENLGVLYGSTKPRRIA